MITYHRVLAVAVAGPAALAALVLTSSASATTANPLAGDQVTSLVPTPPQSAPNLYFFGTAVAMQGNIAVVGASGASSAGANTGAVYVFQKPATGSWRQAKQVAILTANNGASEDQLGDSVAIDGDLIVAGAPDAQIGANVEQGAAYVWTKPSGGWHDETQAAELVSIDGAAHDNFGSAVAVSGMTVVVGAPDKKVGGHSEQGSAYVYGKPIGGWTGTDDTAKILNDNGEASDQFGAAVATDGSQVFIGAPGGVFSGTDNSGVVYQLAKPPTGWSSTATGYNFLVATSAQAGAYFGGALALSGRTLVVGTPDQNIGSNVSQGALYVFVEPAGGWITLNAPSAELTQSDGQNQAGFGNSVAISGSRIIGGASQATVGSVADEGIAAVFTKPAHGWKTAKTKSNVIEPDGETGSFGSGVAIAPSGVIVGADTRDTAWDSGAVYAFGLPVPTVTGLHESHSSWHLGRRPVAVNPKKHHPGGTTFTLHLNRKATVATYLVRHHHGKSKAVGVLVFVGRQGVNKLYFDGRLKGGKEIPAGKYTAFTQAVNSGGVSTFATIKFTAKPKAAH